MLVVGHQDFLALVVERQNPLVDIDSCVDEGHLKVEARGANEIPDRLPETQHLTLRGHCHIQQVKAVQAPWTDPLRCWNR